MDRKEEYQDERWKARAKEIRELDGNQCKMCGATGVELHVHHLSYPPPPFHLWDAADNELVTLCKDCHVAIHKAATRPTISKERVLSDVMQYRIDPYTGNRMVSNEIFFEYCKRGYNGNPFTQQIIDWLREEKLYFIVIRCIGSCSDGGNHERCDVFEYDASIQEPRTSTWHDVGQYTKYEVAEIESIKYLIAYLI